MTLGEKRERFTTLIAQFILALNEMGFAVRIGEVYRTQEQQELYVKTGKSKTMNSSHLSGCAADLNLLHGGALITGSPADAENLRTIGLLWEKMCDDAGVDGEWGGRFGVKAEDYDTKIGWDANHFGLKV